MAGARAQRPLKQDMNRFLSVRSFLRFLLPAALFIALFCGRALASCEGVGTVTASALYIRSEAGTSSSKLTSVARGGKVIVTDTLSGWYKVWYQGYEGYMSADYLTFSETGSGSFGTGTITGSDVRLRTGPGTSYSIVTTCGKGATMSVTGVSGAWYQVSYNGAAAYVSGQYLALSAGSVSSASSSTAASAASSSSAGKSGTVKGTCVRLRSGPGTSYSVLYTLNTGAALTVTDTSGDWYKVSYNGTAGYMYGTYVSLSGETSSSAGTSASSGTKMTVTAAVNVRSGPSTGYSVLTWYARGTEVTVTGYSGSWAKINYGSGSAYIYSSYLTSGTLAAESSVTTAASASSTGSAAQQKLVSTAKNYLGVSYVYGGASPSGFDCSGFVYYVYKLCGYSINRTASAQYSNGTYVSRSDLQPGDIIIFYNSAMSAIGHSGIYIGNDQFIHSSSAQGKVVITSLSGYYSTHYYGARRVVS